jgi:hypothetical protein
MSRRDRRARAKLINAEREQQVLAQPVDMLNSDDPLVQDLMRVFPHMSNAEAFEFALALQHRVRGSNALIVDPQGGEAISKMREEMSLQDKMNTLYDLDRQKFLDGVMSQAERSMPAGDELARLQAKGANMYQSAVTMAKANRASRDMQLTYELEHGAQEVVNVPAKFERHRMGDSEEMVQVPYVISLRNRVFKLGEGTYLVPKVIANLLRQKMRGEQEMRERKSVMRAEKNGMEGLDSTRMEKWAALNKKYGSSNETIPVAGLR